MNATLTLPVVTSPVTPPAAAGGLKPVRRTKAQVAESLRATHTVETAAATDLVECLSVEDTALHTVMSAAGTKAKDNPHAVTGNAINRCLLSWRKRLGNLDERAKKAEAKAEGESSTGAPPAGWVRVNDDERFPLMAVAADVLKAARNGHRGSDALVLTGVTTVPAAAGIAALRSAIPSFAVGVPVSYTLAGKQTRIRARVVPTDKGEELHLSVVK